MWKQKLKICGINLAAYIVVLIIMAMLSVCSRLYGQEKPMLSPEHTKRIAPGIDTTKLPSFEYGKSFLSPHFGIIHKKPEMLLNFRPDYTLGIPVDRSSLHKGEYRVGGVIHRFDKVNVWGRGRQENIIGVGVSNYAEVKTAYSPNERWKLGISLYAHKLSIPRSSSNTFGMGADVSYKLTLLRNSNIGNSRTIPIVAMTARGDRDKEAFLHAGFTDYIYKPFSSSELLGLLSRMKTDRREKKPEVDFSLVLSEVNDKHKALLSLISQSEKDREELDAAMKNGDRHKLREITHRMQPMWEFLRMEEPLLAYRALLKDSKTSDKELKEYTRQIIDSTAMLIKAAEAEIKRLTNETEDTDS